MKNLRDYTGDSPSELRVAASRAQPLAMALSNARKTIAKLRLTLPPNPCPKFLRLGWLKRSRRCRRPAAGVYRFGPPAGLGLSPDRGGPVHPTYEKSCWRPQSAKLPAGVSPAGWGRSPPHSSARVTAYLTNTTQGCEMLPTCLSVLSLMCEDARTPRFGVAPVD